MKNERKEIRITPEGELKIKTKEVEIALPPHLPLKLNRLSERQSKKLLSFCRKKEREYASNISPAHQRATEAIKKAASDIYQSYFLTQEGNRNKIDAFSEIWLGGIRVDCIILGPFGAILVEVKPSGRAAQEQLERSKYFWRKQFPKVPLLTFKASYQGNKVTFRK